MIIWVILGVVIMYSLLCWLSFRRGSKQAEERHVERTARHEEKLERNRRVIEYPVVADNTRRNDDGILTIKTSATIGHKISSLGAQWELAMWPLSLDDKGCLCVICVQVEVLPRSHLRGRQDVSWFSEQTCLPAIQITNPDGSIAKSFKEFMAAELGKDMQLRLTDKVINDLLDPLKGIFFLVHSEMCVVHEEESKNVSSSEEEKGSDNP